MKNKALKISAYFIILFIIFLVIIELFVSFVFSDQVKAERAWGMPAFISYPLSEQDSLYPVYYEKKKNFSGFWETSEFKVNYITNSLGWFDRKYTENEINDSNNIIVLGDSQTSGHCSGSLEGTFCKVMEKAIKDKTGQAVNVMNTGTGGYSTRDALAYYLHRVAGKINHKTVIYMLYLGNDPIDNRPEFQKSAYNGKVMFLSSKENLSWLHHVYAYLYDVSDFFLLYLSKPARPLLPDNTHGNVQKQFLTAVRQNHKDLTAAQASPEFDKDMKMAVSYIKELKKACEENNAKLIVVLLPHETQIYPLNEFLKKKYFNDAEYPAFEQKYDDGRFDNLMKYNDYSGFDLIEFLRDKAGENKPIYLKGDGHLNKNGNEITGHFLADEYIKNVLRK